MAGAGPSGRGLRPVRESAVVGIADPALGEEIGPAVVLRPDATDTAENLYVGKLGGLPVSSRRSPVVAKRAVR